MAVEVQGTTFLTTKAELEAAVIPFIRDNGSRERPVSNEQLVEEINYAAANESEAYKAISAITSELTKTERFLHRAMTDNARGHSILGYFYDFNQKNPDYGKKRLRGDRSGVEGRKAKVRSTRVPRERKPRLPTVIPEHGPWNPQPAAISDVLPTVPVRDWTLRTAIEQIESCQFECEAGPLANNVAWRWILEKLA